MSSKPEDDLLNTIDAESSDPGEQQDSKIILQALHAHKSDLAGECDLPTNDENLSERIRDAARIRSQELSGPAPAVSNRLPNEGEPVPPWMWLLWVVAVLIAGLVLFLVW